MGTGKSTVGRALAARLGYTMLDSDHEIEKKTGRTIAAIFAESGEPEFRRLERDFIENGHPAQGCVVSCGGGLVVQPGMLDLLKKKGVIICLHASLETILARTQGSAHRPLIQAENPMERLRELYTKREPIYRCAGTMILTDGRPLLEVASHVQRAYRREAREWQG